MIGELYLSSFLYFGFNKQTGIVGLVISLWLSFVNFFLIPIVDRCVYPALGAHCPTLFQRFGIGLLLCISASVALIIAMLLLPYYAYHILLVNALLIVAAILLPFAEIFLQISGK